MGPKRSARVVARHLPLPPPLSRVGDGNKIQRRRLDGRRSARNKIPGSGRSHHYHRTYTSGRPPSLPPFSSEIKLMIHPMAPCLPSRQETIHVATAGLLSLPCFQVPTSGLVSLNSCLRVFKLNPERRGHRFLLHPQEHADPDWIRGPDGRSFGSTHPGPI